MAMNGVLTLTVIRARNLKDTEVIAKMDPYCKLILGREVQKTRQHENGGKHPVWNHAMMFNVHEMTPEESIRVEIYDKDLMSDDLIGQGRWSLKSLVMPGPVPTWHQVYDKHNQRPCGDVELIAEFKGSNSPYQSVQYPQTQQYVQPQVVQPIYQQPQQVYQQPQQVYQQPQPVYQQPQPVYQQQQVVQTHSHSGGVHDTADSSHYVVHSRTNGCHGGQNQWQWCNKCSNLCFSGVNLGVCSTGGGHDFKGSSDYTMFKDSDNMHGYQAGWRWCSKCQILYFSGTNAGICPATRGHHDPNGSSNYVMPTESVAQQPHQAGWRWCRKCMGVHYHQHRGHCLA